MEGARDLLLVTKSKSQKDIYINSIASSMLKCILLYVNVYIKNNLEA